MLDRASGPEARRRLGAWDTPRDLADALCSLAVEHLGRRPELVLDPSCGTGNFLVAAADLLAADGLAPERIPERLVGVDVDPTSVVATRAALVEWVVGRGLDPTAADAADLRVVDALRDPLADLRGRVDLVVGNPPFLSQTSAGTTRDDATRLAVRGRFGDLGPYVDSAAVFLLAAVEQLRDGGVAVLVQPSSFLSARDTSTVRRRLLEQGRLVALWGSDELHFDASIHVCAPVVRAGADRHGRVDVRWGSSVGRVAGVQAPAPGSSWGPMLAVPAGVPLVDPLPERTPRLESLAATTAGFRDEFYALSAAARDPGEAGHDESAPRLVTVGMVDPFRSTWGQRLHRLGGRRLSAPRLYATALGDASPRAADWVRRRSRPKVLVATQTRVVEAVADPVGDWIPVTPVVSVEPHDPGDVWRVLAALASPPVSAWLAAEHLGSGRSPGSVRCSAGSTARVPLPVDVEAWDRGVLLARRLADADSGTRGALLGRFGRTMAEAHGRPADDELLDWWLARATRT